MDTGEKPDIDDILFFEAGRKWAFLAPAEDRASNSALLEACKVCIQEETYFFHLSCNPSYSAVAEISQAKHTIAASDAHPELKLMSRSFSDNEEKEQLER